MIDDIHIGVCLNIISFFSQRIYIYSSTRQAKLLQPMVMNMPNDLATNQKNTYMRVCMPASHLNAIDTHDDVPKQCLAITIHSKNINHIYR